MRPFSPLRPRPSRTRRTFTHFQTLHDSLCKAGYTGPGLPGKSIFGRFDSNVVEQRRAAFQAMLEAAFADPRFRALPALRAFVAEGGVAAEGGRTPSPSASPGTSPPVAPPPLPPPPQQQQQREPPAPPRPFQPQAGVVDSAETFSRVSSATESGSSFQAFSSSGFGSAKMYAPTAEVRRIQRSLILVV